MGKFEKSFFNSITSLLSIFTNSIFSIILVRIVIENLGSDYNGVNATATQILTLLTLIEGGFTTASIVSLFEPYVKKDYAKINNILTTTSKIFKKIGILTLLLGIILSIVYSFIIKSSLEQYVIIIVFILSISSTSFNFLFVNNYRLLYQVAQNEYIINSISIIINFLTQLAAMFVIIQTKNIILVRIVYFFSSIVNGITIIVFAKKKYPFISLNGQYNPKLINGTKDVLVGKFTYVIYSSATVIFLSTFVGTIATSIYATYNSIVNIIKNCIYSFVNAPQNAIGQLIASNDRNNIIKVFNEYEYIVILVESILLSITYTMIIPFIKLYTNEISDINYVNYILPFLIIFNVYIEVIHIPSSVVIMMSGEFKVSKNIQLVTCILLIICNLIGGFFFGLYGILIATMLVNLLLAFSEMIFARKYKIKTDFKRYFSIYLPIILLTLIITFIESNIIWFNKISIFYFICYCLVISFINLSIILLISLLLNKKETISIISRVLKMLKLKKLIEK